MGRKPTVDFIPDFEDLRKGEPFEKQGRFFVAFHYTEPGTQRSRRRALPNKVLTRDAAKAEFKAWRVAQLAANKTRTEVTFFDLCDYYETQRKVGPWIMRRIREFVGDVPPEQAADNETVRAFTKAMLDEGIARTTVREYAMKLVGIFSTARDNGKLPWEFKIPKEARDELPEAEARYTYLPTDRWDALQDWAEDQAINATNVAERSTALWLVIAMVCSNRGEVGANLTWDQVTNLHSPTSCRVNFLKDGEVMPWNKKRNHPVVTPKLQQILLWHWEHRRNPANPYICVSPKLPLAYITLESIRLRLAALPMPYKCLDARKDGDFPVKPHDIRRSFIKRAIDMGRPPAETARFVNETLEVMMKHYAHWDEARQSAEVVNFLDAQRKRK